MFRVVMGERRVFVQELYTIWSKIITENLLTNSDLHTLIVYDCFEKRIQLDGVKKRDLAFRFSQYVICLFRKVGNLQTRPSVGFRLPPNLSFVQNIIKSIFISEL